MTTPIAWIHNHSISLTINEVLIQATQLISSYHNHCKSIRLLHFTSGMLNQTFTTYILLRIVPNLQIRLLHLHLLIRLMNLTNPKKKVVQREENLPQRKKHKKGNSLRKLNTKYFESFCIYNFFVKKATNTNSIQIISPKKKRTRKTTFRKIRCVRKRKTSTHAGKESS